MTDAVTQIYSTLYSKLINGILRLGAGSDAYSVIDTQEMRRSRLHGSVPGYAASPVSAQSRMTLGFSHASIEWTLIFTSRCYPLFVLPGDVNHIPQNWWLHLRYRN